MEFWQILGLVGITNVLMTILSFRWGYTEGKLEMIKAMLERLKEREYQLWRSRTALPTNFDIGQEEEQC